MDSRSRKSLRGNAVVCAWREAFVAEGGVEAVRAVGAWFSRQWGRVRRAVGEVATRLAREFSPVLPCHMADAVPVLPVVESVSSVYYATTTVTVTGECQRWVCPEVRAMLATAVQRVAAERVAATPEVLYVRKGARYVVAQEGTPHAAPRFRRVASGKATRYHAV